MAEFTLKITVADGDNMIFPVTRDTLADVAVAWAERNGYSVTVTDDHSEGAIEELCKVIDSAVGFLMSKARRDPAEREIVSQLAECLRKYSPPAEAEAE